MSLIGGTPFNKANYWSSTQYSNVFSWSLYLMYGNLSSNYKFNKLHIRALCQLSNNQNT